MAMARLALKQRREQLHLTQEQVALALGVATSTYRGWELGSHAPLLGARPKLARVLDVSRPELDRLLFGELVELNGQAVPAWFGTFAALEQGSAQLWAYEPIVVHGLLQTPDYATAVEYHGPGLTSDEAIAQRVERRVTRQRVLDRGPDPLDLAVILDESVLYRQAGSRDVMAGQLDHLAAMATRPNVDLRVITFDAEAFAASFGAFTVLQSRDSPAPYMVVIEDRSGGNYHDRPPVVEAHVQLFGHLLDSALSPEETVDLIEVVNKERYQR